MKKQAMAKIVEINKQELSTEKVELARKPQSILSQLKKIDGKMSSEESKLDKIYLNYKQSQKEWIDFLKDIESDIVKLEDELVEILNKAQEIGVDGRQIDGFSQAADLVTKLRSVARGSMGLYPRI